MNSFVRLPKKVRQALDCGWPKNYRTQLQIPNFEPAPKGLFLITGLELDLWLPDVIVVFAAIDVAYSRRLSLGYPLFYSRFYTSEWC